MKTTKIAILTLMALAACGKNDTKSAEDEINDSTTPLHLLQPDYKTPYGQLNPDSVKADIDRVFNYIESVTPAKMTDGKVNQGTYRLTSYEWAVMYDALLDAAKITGDKKYADYVSDRIRFLAEEADKAGDVSEDGQLRQVKDPRTLDDAGAMAGAWMRAAMADSTLKISPYIERYWEVVEQSPVHLADGTIARNRPHYNAIWLDDMFMALPSMAVRSQYKDHPEQLDEAARIATGFFKRMWMPEKQIFRHGYLEDATHQPSMAWGRANGWAILTLCQLLDYLPENHPKRAEILDIYRKHAAGLAELQGIDGFWHQLLDRPETYEETSATAIFAYALAHGVNEGWLEATTYGPVAQLAWEAVSTKINPKGEVEGVCVGTGMGFDPAYYAYRPVSVKAAHGYGPAIWAGAEVYRMLKDNHPYVNDSAVHYYDVDPEATMPLFSLDKDGKAIEIRH
ncbi:MAG: glycoside hydrolase family 88 protein [Muribaculaceae bacterium]|nr:glycoside hydrolase family 88 protein [Muribaculaceae bacterium]MDE6551473.1 glycoside hydrolase family 88 protein [Muribaculaceae bacterium]